MDSAILVPTGDTLMSSLHQSLQAIRFVAIAGLLLGWMANPASRLFGQEQAAPVEKIPFERRPYAVNLLVAFDTAAFDDHASQKILAEIGQTANRCVGSLWALESRRISWLAPVNSVSLERLTRPVIEQNSPGAAPDLWFVATVESQMAGIRISVRSWQPEVHSETLVASSELADHRDIPVTILRLCRDLARPIGIVEQVEDRSVRVRLRAGELTPPDLSFSQLSNGDLLIPLMAYRDKNNVTLRLQPIPWTYVMVESVEASTVQATIQSGLRTPLGGKKRGRIDTLLVAIRPQRSSTRLELVTQAKTPLALIGHRIEVRSQPLIPRPTKEDPDIDPASTLLRELLTDRRGLSTVPLEIGQSLVWLFVYSGDQQLARVPIVPGLDDRVRLEVPDDSTRLTAEADLQMLQGEVIDAVALRNTAFSTIRAAAKSDDWPVVNQKLKLLQKLPSSGTLLDRLNAVRVLGTAAAKKRKDRVAEVRINRICDDTTTLINAHLSDDKVRLLVEEMEALQKTSAANDNSDENKSDNKKSDTDKTNSLPKK